ncbi:uncharacterized protein LOC116289604 [Actinia tenebrosa]|uniref:Uncharacterized protein LOC116289604 n=1 Tax=Actinia tenebrosa TaxID=6105 RepID=A0A6P8HA22_ACTTE|nr:uncharacterized protein LOC116289604 [Actinia tenebrosa]
MRDHSTPGSQQSGNRMIRGHSAYRSTYASNYLGTLSTPVPNGRVRTSQFYPSGRPPIASTYQADFMTFPVNKRVCIPYGSSSGYRKNNPHPHNMEAAFKHPNKDYFVWSQYRRLPPLGDNDGSVDSQTLLKKVCQDKIRSIYQQDFKDPPYATAPIAYSNYRRKMGKSLYKDSYEGTFGNAADSAKPDPYEYPSKDDIGTSTYRDNFKKTKTLQLPLLPTSPTRRNNPHPSTMNNTFHFPKRGYWVWPHYLLPVKYDNGDKLPVGPRIPEDLRINRIRGPFDTWEDQSSD